MSTALAVFVVALNFATLAIVWLYLERRLDAAKSDFYEQLNAIEAGIPGAPIIAPDPRVDELMRVVSTLKGAEALRQVYKNG